MSSSRSMSYSRVGSVGSGSFWGGGDGARTGYGYSVGMGLGGSLQSQRFGLGSGVGGGLGVGGSRFGLGLASGGGGGGFGLASGGGGASGAGASGGRFASGWSSGGGLQPPTTNKKLELQFLNDRLAAYLDKVKRLETANHELEEKLRGFTANKVQVSYDMKAYQNQLQPLQDQIRDLLKDCSRLTLSIDNTKLAADNFRMKFENEFAVRKVVEEDVAALKALKKEYDLTNSALKQDYQILLKDQETLEKTHQEEVLSLRGQVAGTLTVDIKEPDAVDLSRRLADLRSEYETIVERNHRETEHWYTKKLSLNVTGTGKVTEVTVTGSAEISTSQSQILNLQTELDALLLKKSYEEQRLVDVQEQKQMQLLALSRLAGNLEGELASVRESALQQSRDYQLLLSTKVQLEREISTYKSLLERAGDLSKIAGLNVPTLQTRSAEVSVTAAESSSSVAAEVVPEVSADLQASSAEGGEGGAAVEVEGSGEHQPSPAGVTGEGGGGEDGGEQSLRNKRSISSPYEAFLD
uniref:Keratin, type I cytoskeletal 47 kDa-like n=1 Tax=Astyanax mexicanus TaxID=7994 RepID=A0A3B1IK23_ASTMX